MMRAPAWWQAAQRAMAQARRWLTASSCRASLVAGVLGFALAAAATMTRGGISAPRVHDEFSYLLAADTYAHGRLTNPTPPFSEHFQTFHVLLVPTYASKYPPAQGLALALGQVLTGEPIVGVWLGYGLLCGALTWMLFGWVPPRWALWGGVFAGLWLVGRQAIGAAFEPAFWATSYWGGAIAASGSAMLFGGLRRVVERPRVLPAVVMALGLGVLANSRPSEGLFVALVPCAVLVAWLIRSRSSSAVTRLVRVAVPMLAVLLAVVASMAWLNYRVTGSPWRLPYVTYELQQGVFRPFRTGAATTPREPATHVARARSGSAGEDEIVPRRARGPKPGFGLGNAARFYLPPYLLVLVFGLPWLARDRWAWLAAGSAGLVAAGLVVESWRLSHYAAPAVGPLVILITLAARRLSLLESSGRRVGRALVRLVLAAAVIWAVKGGVDTRLERAEHAHEWPSQRRALLEKFHARGGRHLVLVSYGPRHSEAAEWVYNAADIYASPVVWARSLGPERDGELIARLSGRSVWHLQKDDDDGPYSLEPATP
jgi:hypothetical protein